MNKMHGLWKAEGKQYSARLGNDFVEFEIFFKVFL